MLVKSKSLTLWCHGKHTRKSRSPDADQGGRHDDATESDAEVGRSKGKRHAQLDRRRVALQVASRVQELKSQLEQKHGTQFTGYQYRLWAEMVFTGVHKDMDEASNAWLWNTA